MSGASQTESEADGDIGRGIHPGTDPEQSAGRGSAQTVLRDDGNRKPNRHRFWTVR